MMRLVTITPRAHHPFRGCYVAVTVITRTGSYLLAMGAAIALVALMGVVEWEGFLKGFRGQDHALAQVLTTMGLALIFQDVALLIWGGDPQNIRLPAILSGRYQVGVLAFPVYRIFIILVAVAVAGILWRGCARARAGGPWAAPRGRAAAGRGLG